MGRVPGEQDQGAAEQCRVVEDILVRAEEDGEVCRNVDAGIVGD